MFPLLSAFV